MERVLLNSFTGFNRKKLIKTPYVKKYSVRRTKGKRILNNSKWKKFAKVDDESALVQTSRLTDNSGKVSSIVKSHVFVGNPN